MACRRAQCGWPESSPSNGAARLWALLAGEACPHAAGTGTNCTESSSCGFCLSDLLRLLCRLFEDYMTASLAAHSLALYARCWVLHTLHVTCVLEKRAERWREQRGKFRRPEENHIVAVAANASNQ